MDIIDFPYDQPTASPAHRMRARQPAIARFTARALAPALTSLALVLALPANGAPPYSADLVQGGNRWLIDAYDDSDPDHAALATPGICFEYAGVSGTHQRYTWYSDTFLGWRGTATQEADQIFLHGSYANGNGHDAIQVRIIIDSPRNGAVGHWQEWREDSGYGRTIGFANARMIRAGDCTLSASEARSGQGLFPLPFPLPGTNDNPMTFK